MSPSVYPTSSYVLTARPPQCIPELEELELKLSLVELLELKLELLELKLKLWLLESLELKLSELLELDELDEKPAEYRKRQKT